MKGIRTVLSAKTILWSILLVAFLLRFIGLAQYPSGFHGDEASFLLNAKALMLTGHDEDGQLLPLYIRSFIDPQPALYAYLQIPFIALLGTTHTAARLPAVILGVISVYLMYLLMRRVRDKTTGLVAAGLLAVSPWHIMLSRGSQQVMMAFVFGLAAILFLLKFLEGKRLSWWNFVGFVGFFFLSLYSYQSAKVVLPLLIGYMLVSAWLHRMLSRKAWLFVLSLTGISLLLGIFITGFTRVGAVSIFTNPHTQLLLDEKIRTATFGAPYLLIRLFVNKIVDYGLAIISNYAEYFTMNFLFLSGGEPMRYVIPFQGLLYLFEVVLLGIGLWQPTQTKKSLATKQFFVFWLLIAPLPGALTTEEIPSTTRTFFLLIPLLYFISLGFLRLWSEKGRIRQWLLRAGLIVSYLAGFSYFLFAFFVQQPYYHPWYRDYGSEQLPGVVKRLSHQYQAFSISTNQYVYFTLAGVIPLADLQHSFPKRLGVTSTYGTITFHKDDCVFTPKEGTLTIIKGSCTLNAEQVKQSGFTRVGSVNFKDGVPEYLLFSYKKPSLPAQ